MGGGGGGGGGGGAWNALGFMMVYIRMSKKTCLQGLGPDNLQTSRLSYGDWLEYRAKREHSREEQTTQTTKAWSDCVDASAQSDLHLCCSHVRM